MTTSQEGLGQILGKLIEDAGGKVEEVAFLPDGSGFATASFPLRKDHWLYADEENEPPMPFRVGTTEMLVVSGRDGQKKRFIREELAAEIRKAARYAIRASTMNGKDSDFDPDAMVNNFVIGLIGVWTPDGLSRL